MSQRIPAFDDCVIRGDPFLQIILLIVRVAFNLQYRWIDRCGSEYFFQTLGFEVAQADALHFTFSDSFFHIFPCAQVIPELLMQQQEVDVIRLQTLQHFVDGFCCLAFAVFAWPQFRRDPDFFSRKAAFFYSLTDSALVLIGMRSIDMTIA